MLALMGSSTISFAASVAAANCAHEHSHAPGSQPHKHHDAGCLSCCLGACMAIPDLPSRRALDVVPFATSVSYWEIGASLSGRSIDGHRASMTGMGFKVAVVAAQQPQE
jgi:hypothetical protein